MTFKRGCSVLITALLLMAGGWLLPGVSASAQTQEEVIAVGLAAWRKADANGMACANCHSPDGFELARFNFSDEDIRRRAAIHLDSADSDKIIALIHALRDQYTLHGRLLDPLTDRPFQPGGRVIEGATSQERDYSTALQTFAPRLPTLFNTRIDSLDKALLARDEILAFDPRNEPIGIPFPRLSEDIHHGQEHGLLNDWFTELARIPLADKVTEWYALHDRYLADPNEANLWAILNGVDVFTADLASPNTNKFATAKYKSLLLGQHLLREAVLGRTELSARQPVAFLQSPGGEGAAGARTIIHNPLFAVGSHAHQNRPAATDFPAVVLGSLNSEFNQQLEQMMLPWWYMAWIFNPGLPDVANRHEYFPQAVEGHLGGEPYPLHHEYVQIKMALTRAYVPWVRRVGEAPTAEGLNLSRASRGFDYGDAQAARKFFNAEHQRLYRTFAANLRRMQLYLLLNELDHQCAEGVAFQARVGDVLSFVETLRTELQPELDQVEPQHKVENDALIARVIAALERGQRGCTAPEPPLGSGVGLRAELFDHPDFTAPLGERLDPTVNFFATVANAPLIAPEAGQGIAIRWTGQVEPRYNERYTFNVAHGQHTQAGIRLWVDGQLLIDTWEGGVAVGRVVGWPGGHHYAGEITLNAGQRYDLKLEYKEEQHKQSIRLFWESASQLVQVIPQSQLYPPTEVAQTQAYFIWLPVVAR